MHAPWVCDQHVMVVAAQHAGHPRRLGTGLEDHLGAGEWQHAFGKRRQPRRKRAARNHLARCADRAEVGLLVTNIEAYGDRGH
jgi:hypothetical protein